MFRVPPWNGGTHGTHGTRIFYVPERENGMTKCRIYDPRVSFYDHAAVLYDQTTSQYDPRADFMTAIYDQTALFMTKCIFMTKSVPPWNTSPANIDGFTPEQRFFLGWAQVWAGKYTPEAERQQVAGKRARVCPAGASTAHSQTCPNSPPPSAANKAPR